MSKLLAVPIALLSALLLIRPALAAGLEGHTRQHATRAHGGFLTGHFEFDAAIVLIFFAFMTYSFLLPEDSPRGMARRAIQMLALALGASAIVLAAIGLRNMVTGTL